MEKLLKEAKDAKQRQEKAERDAVVRRQLNQKLKEAEQRSQR